MPLLAPGRLKAIRTEAGETQADLAAVIERDRSFVTHLENGANDPSLETLIRIARHYNVSPDWLLGFSDERLPRHGGKPLEDDDQRAFFAAYRSLTDQDRSLVERFINGIRGGATEPPVSTRRRKRDNAA
jgi:transcriptional regulator with XRE-family HTH domain